MQNWIDRTYCSIKARWYPSVPNSSARVSKLYLEREREIHTIAFHPANLFTIGTDIPRFPPPSPFVSLPLRLVLKVCGGRDKTIPSRLYLFAFALGIAFDVVDIIRDSEKPGAEGRSERPSVLDQRGRRERGEVAGRDEVEEDEMGQEGFAGRDAGEGVVVY